MNKIIISGYQYGGQPVTERPILSGLFVLPTP